MGLGGEMEGCGKFMKYSMFVANTLILLGGIVILAIGIWTKVDKRYLEDFLGTNLYVSAAYILIFAGVAIILISFLGCMGAVKEVKCMLLTYFIIVLLIFIVLMIGGILGYVFREKVKDTMRSEMYNSLQKYQQKESVRSVWDQTQQVIQCCGVENYRDWEQSLGSSHIPASCCRREDDQACQTQPTIDRIFPDGCFPKASEAIRENAAIIGGVGIAIACILILGMIFSCALFKLIE